MTHAGTGDAMQSEAVGYHAPAFVPNTDVQPDRCAGYRLIHDKSGGHGPTVGTTSRKGGPAPAAAPTPAQRYELAACMAQTKRDARRMAESAGQDDPLEVARAGMALVDDLRTLWKARALREDEWPTVVNFLQGVLSQKDLERLTKTQCAGIRTIVHAYLAGGAVRDSDVQLVVRMLRRVGLDPYAPIRRAEP